MTISEIKKHLSAEVIFCPDENVEIEMACGSDLMSDVLAFAKSNSFIHSLGGIAITSHPQRTFGIITNLSLIQKP